MLLEIKTELENLCSNSLLVFSLLMLTYILLCCQGDIGWLGFAAVSAGSLAAVLFGRSDFFFVILEV